MTPEVFDTITVRDFENGAVRDEIRRALKEIVTLRQRAELAENTAARRQTHIETNLESGSKLREQINHLAAERDALRQQVAESQLDLARIRQCRHERTTSVCEGGAHRVQCRDCGMRWSQECDHKLRQQVTDLEGRLAHSQRENSSMLVAGVYMDRSLADFRRACEVHIEEEQQKPLPDNALIATLCDAVRLTREAFAFSPDCAKSELVNFRQQVANALNPVRDWYDGDGERTDDIAMLSEAVLDLVQDRQELLVMRNKAIELGDQLAEAHALGGMQDNEMVGLRTQLSEAEGQIRDLEGDLQRVTDSAMEQLKTATQLHLDTASKLATAENELCTARDQIPDAIEGESLSVGIMRLRDEIQALRTTKEVGASWMALAHEKAEEAERLRDRAKACERVVEAAQAVCDVLWPSGPGCVDTLRDALAALREG